MFRTPAASRSGGVFVCVCRPLCIESARNAFKMTRGHHELCLVLPLAGTCHLGSPEPQGADSACCQLLVPAEFIQHSTHALSFILMCI